MGMQKKTITLNYNDDNIIDIIITITERNHFLS